MKFQAKPSAGIGLMSVVYHMKLQALPSGLHALLWSFRFVSDIYRGETARHGFRGAGFASGFKSCRAVPDI